MIKIFKDSFKISCENILLATPLLLFLLLINFYLIIAKGAVTALPSAFLFFITLYLMVSAFFAGWFYIIKVVVDKHRNGIVSDKDKDSFKLLSEFPIGVSEYFKSFMGFTLLFIIFLDITMVSVYYLGNHIIGSIGITYMQMKTATESPVAAQALIESLTNIQLLKINYWYLLCMVTLMLFSLLTMFWPMEILYSTKNPLRAFFYSISNIFIKPKSILLFLCIIFLNFIMMMLNYILMFNPITYFIMTLIYFYFIVYLFVLLFLYYEEKIKTYSDSSTDSNGKK